jgi:hypothetical protein
MTFTIRQRSWRDGFHLESEGLSQGGLWYPTVDYAVSSARHRAGAKRATIKIYDEAGVLIQTIEHDPLPWYR